MTHTHSCFIVWWFRKVYPVDAATDLDPEGLKILRFIFEISLAHEINPWQFTSVFLFAIVPFFWLDSLSLYNINDSSTYSAFIGDFQHKLHSPNTFLHTIKIHDANAIMITRTIVLTNSIILLKFTFWNMT